MKTIICLDMTDWTESSRPIVALSPMADFTDSAFCRRCRRFGAQVVFHEMVSAEALIRNNVRTLRMTTFDAGERPVIQQVFGADPAAVAEAIRIIDAEYGPDGFTISLMMQMYRGNVSRMAQVLDISRTTLWRKLKQYGFDPDEYR